MRRSALSRWVAVLAATGFLWTVALGVSPGLHERIHADKRTDHSCAVTFVRAGNYHHAAPPQIDTSEKNAEQFAPVPELAPCWVPSLFLSAAIFEHAPPVCS